VKHALEPVGTPAQLTASSEREVGGVGLAGH
jgi:hypothetical protein